ncbi:type II TA system antitoxin MqsA family protein [Entomomonas asaccharolytica]|nr:type II TA system antitoxin MqsA family protein [Entomomonas asaccharolytica]
MKLYKKGTTMTINKCPECSAKLVKDKKDFTYVYKGESVTLKKLPGLYCTGCDEVIYDSAISRLINDAANILNKKVNAKEINPEFIINVRKKLGLTQQEAADIFGGGVNAFSRYETGRAVPPVSVLKLLKILDKHPELLAELKEH